MRDAVLRWPDREKSSVREPMTLHLRRVQTWLSRGRTGAFRQGRGVESDEVALERVRLDAMIDPI